MDKTIYAYSCQSGEYLSQSLADESPLEPGAFIIPACATETPPPETKPNEVACFSNGSWSLKPDFRGKYWDTVSMEMHEIIDIDIEPDPAWTNKEPVAGQMWNGNDWILDIPGLLSSKVTEVIIHSDQQDAKPFEYPEGFGIFYKVTNAIKETIDFCELSGCIDTDPLPVNGGSWDNVDGTISTPMTVAELKALYIYGYGIPAHNYSNMKAHIAALMLLAEDENVLPEEIGNYDYSTGWR